MYCILGHTVVSFSIAYCVKILHKIHLNFIFFIFMLRGMYFAPTLDDICVILIIVLQNKEF